MPLLDQPDPSVLKPTLYSFYGDERQQRQSAGPRPLQPTEGMLKFGADQQKQQELQTLASQYLGDPNNPDYEGLISAWGQRDPEGALRMKQQYEKSLQEHAQTTSSQSKAVSSMLDEAKPVVRSWIERPDTYTPDARAGVVKTFGPMADKFLPQPGDPDLVPKLEGVYRVVDEHSDYLKGRAEAAQTYGDGKKVEGMLMNLAIADTPEKWALASKEAQAASLGDLVTQAQDATGAQAMLQKRQALEPQKATAEEKGQHIEGMYQGKRTFGTYNPVTKSIEVDGKPVSASEFRPIPPQSAMGGGGGAGAPEIQIKPGTRHYRTAVDLASGALPLADFQRMFGRGQQLAGLKEAMYDTAKQINPEFSPAAYEMGLKVASNPKIVQQVGLINNVLSGVPDLLAASNAASSSGARLLNSYIPKGGLMVGGKAYSNLRTARTAFADELSGALGYGSATDMSREMGFDMTDTTLSPDKFQSAVQDIVIPFVNRKKKSIVDLMGVYGKPGMSPAAGAASKFSVTDPNGKVHPFDTQAQADAFKKLAGVK